MELVINFSGGKDSCVMLHYICRTYPYITKHVVMADTGWEYVDAIEWATNIAARYGLQLFVVKSTKKDFFSMVRHRRKFPSKQIRQCTSDLKRAPIEKWIRNNCKDSLIINCLGLRSEESTDRAKRPALRRNKKQTNSKRTVWDWLPLKQWKEEEIWQYLKRYDLPVHPVYDYLPRFSCRVCIFMSLHNLRMVKRYDPAAIDMIIALEREIQFSMRPDGFLDQIL